jgi:hypothetical protein
MLPKINFIAPLGSSVRSQFAFSKSDACSEVPGLTPPSGAIGARPGVHLPPIKFNYLQAY